MIVPHRLRVALRRLAQVFQSTRSKSKSLARPIPEAVIAKYHRAIWAIDTLGPAAEEDRWALREIWRNATHVAANISGPDGAIIAEDLIKTLNELCEKTIRDCEKDPNRAEWEKQRDFLIGSLRRVRRAMQLNDVTHLHFFKKQDQSFNIDVSDKHPQFQIGYDLWQGIRAELKEAITFALYSNRPPHYRVELLLQQMRSLLSKIEFPNESVFDGFDPRQSKLHLSAEQQGRILWEQVREDAARAIAQGEKVA